jgi:hypothetical protein
MGWTWLNAIFIVIGLVAVTGCILLIKYREAVFKTIVEQNTNMYGKKVGGRLKRTSPIWGVVVPAGGGIAIGTIFVLVGLFGHPH